EDMLKEIDNLGSAPTTEATPGTTSQAPAGNTVTGSGAPVEPVLTPETQAQVPPQPRVKAVPGQGTPIEGPRGKLRLVGPEGKVRSNEPPPSEPMSAEMPLQDELDADIAELEPVKQASGAPGAERFVRPQAVKAGGKSGGTSSSSQGPVVQLKPKATGKG